MPVIPYVHRDYAGRPAPAQHSHETNAAIDILMLLWRALHEQDVTYAVICNVEELGMAQADLVILSERGLGVLELKHHSGPIRRVGDEWYSGSRLITTNDGRNPHQQVQGYAEEMRNKLLESKLDWLNAEQSDGKPFRIHTAVCFTHPDVCLDELLADMRSAKRWHRRQPSLSWEEFSVLTPQQVPQWAVTLSFTKAVRSSITGLGYESYRLTSEEIARFATTFLDAMVWQEAMRLMPPGKPYGVLLLTSQREHKAVFTLDRDELIIGRNPQECSLVIPDGYTLVSNVHARIQRIGRQVWLTDLGSTNGTYLGGQKVAESQLLEFGHRIRLGSRSDSPKACVLELQSTDYLFPGPTDHISTALNVR